MLNLVFEPDVEQVTPCKSIPFTSKVGIEIEVENIKVLPELRQSKYWDIVCDGSLRNNGREFVFKKPLGGVDINRALLELTRMFKTQKGKHSNRTSVHVHVDVRDMSERSLSNFLFLYALLENTLYQEFGPGRQLNNNCVPVNNSPLFYHICHHLYNYQLVYPKRGGDLDIDVFNDMLLLDKYCGVNISSIVHEIGPGVHRGSLEFRLMAGTHNTRRLRAMCKLFLKMKEVANDINIISRVRNLVLTEQEVVDTLLDIFCAELKLLTPDLEQIKEPLQQGASAGFNLLMYADVIDNFLTEQGVA